MYTPPEEPKNRPPLDAERLAHELLLAQAREAALRPTRKKKESGGPVLGLFGAGFGTWVVVIGLLFFAIVCGMRYLSHQISQGIP